MHMAGCKWITYKGHKILFADYKGLRDHDIVKMMQSANKMVEEAEDRVLGLSDFSGTYATDEIVKYLQSEDSKQTAKKFQKNAVVGVTGIKKMFLNVYNMVTGGGAKPFDNLESAKEYLIS
jgi:hypothetical protein